jgi:hypothetical protein
MAKKAKGEDDVISRLAKATEDLGKLGPGLTDHARKRLKGSIEGLAEALQKVAQTHDPIQRPSSVFDPTDPKIPGKVVALSLVAQPRVKIDGMPPFYGSGVYAIYYSGDDPAYRALRGSEHPIYVGKADPVSGRAKDPHDQGTKLHARLQEHGRSIRNATNLHIDDFDCRALVVATGWQKSAEDYLISVFRPIWNSEVNICFGIGKHGDSALTRKNKRSPWDTMHPGRAWANATEGDQWSRPEIVAKIQAHFSKSPPFESREAIVLRLLEDMRQ